MTFGAEPLPARHLAYLNLLAELHQPDLTIDKLENLVKHDVSLSYRVLRGVNSAGFGVPNEIHSIRQALVLLGIEQVRKWASVWSLAGLNSGRASEIVTVAVLRARCCELLGTTLLGADAGSEFFLLGLCSLLDTMLGRPMSDALAEVPLSTEIRNALLGRSNVPRLVLDSVLAYERGAWDASAGAGRDAGLPDTILPVSYADALRWAKELL
jgi:EAL and modified HD-GYP domain-containing signal transduction protein